MRAARRYCLFSFFFLMLTMMFVLSVAASGEDWKEYPLKYAGTICLPSDWDVSYPPPGIEALVDTSRFWIEFLATSSEDIKLKAELTVLWFKGRNMRVPRSNTDWRIMTELAVKAKYKPELKTGTFSHLSEFSFSEDKEQGGVFTYAIRSAAGLPELHVKFLLICYDNQIFLLRMHYPPISESTMAEVVSGIRSQWRMPPPSASFPWFWGAAGLVAVVIVLFVLRSRRCSNEDF